MLEQRWGEAEASYRHAAEIQEAKLDNLTDPPGFWYPVRRSVAAALLAGGNPRAAIVEAQLALARCPFEPQTLRILAKSEQAIGQGTEAARQLTAARANWVGDIASVPLTLL